MTKLTPLISILGIFIFTTCFGQQSNEFGIGLTTESDQRVFFNYNMALDKNRSINFRLSQGWFKDEDFGGSRFYQSSSGETNYEASYITDRRFQSKLTIGPEFQIKESNFSWGIEGILGYRLETLTVITNTHDTSPFNGTANDLIINYPFKKSVVFAFYKREYFTTGLQGRFSLKALATEKIGVKIFGEVGLEYNIRFTDDVEYDQEPEPISEPIETAVVFTFPKNILIPRARLGASIYLKQ
jgi:hypothetical protein